MKKLSNLVKEIVENESINSYKKGAILDFDKLDPEQLLQKLSKKYKFVSFITDDEKGIKAAGFESHWIFQVEVELDYNKGDENAGSHSMVAAGVGYLKGLGFNNVSTKPDVQVAVKAANNIVN